MALSITLMLKEELGMFLDGFYLLHSVKLLDWIV